MSLKNFFVRAEKLREGVAGLRYAKYLISKTHPNHSNTEIVEILNKAESWINLANYSANSNNIYKCKAGGRPTKRFGHSYVFSLPKGAIAPTQSEWKKVTAVLLNDLSEKIGIDKHLLARHSLVVAHNQSNPHIHILVSSVINNRTINQQLSSERTSYALKLAFNKACSLILNLNTADYMPKEKRNTRYSKITFERKLIEKSHKYFQRWIMAISANELSQIKRQENRLLKALEELKSINTSEYKRIINELNSAKKHKNKSKNTKGATYE